MWKILRSMPRVFKLEVFCRLRVVGANAHRYVLMPKDTSPALGEVFLFPSQLDTLTILNPSLTDRLFCHLPNSLNHLFLDFIPHWENMFSSRDSLAYHQPAEMLKFLLRMERMNRCNGTMNLEELRIKMGWCATPEILRRISQMFPNLKDRGTESESDMVCVVVVYKKALAFSFNCRTHVLKVYRISMIFVP